MLNYVKMLDKTESVGFEIKTRIYKTELKFYYQNAVIMHSIYCNKINIQPYK